jgi:formylmethanofuran dehydrogenase subunit E
MEAELTELLTQAGWTEAEFNAKVNEVTEGRSTQPKPTQVNENEERCEKCGRMADKGDLRSVKGRDVCYSCMHDAENESIQRGPGREVIEAIDPKAAAANLRGKPVNALFPDAADKVEAGVCPICQKPVGAFRDARSEKEFHISGLCQACQDVVFDE